MLIESKKQLFDLLPSEFQTPKNKKFLGKVFSIGASNYWKVELFNNNLSFKYENEFIILSCDIAIKSIIANNHINIHLNKLTFKESGYTINVPDKKHYKYFLTKNNEILGSVFHEYDSYKNFFRRSDIIGTGDYNSLCNEIIRNNTKCFEKIEWADARSYSCVFCTEDCGIFKKGMIIDTYYQHISSSYFLRNPLELVNGGVYAGKYRINFNISCDLNKLTLEQLKEIKTDYFSCNKGAYGCQNGCVHSCTANEANNCDTILKNTFIKFKERCMV